MIGAGLSGLVTAYALERRGVRVITIEATESAGGVLRTHREDGFLVEAGANSALDNSVLLRRLIDELGLAGERVETAPAAANRYIVRHGKLVALPTSLPALVGSRLFSTRAKLRLLREPFVSRGAAADEETVAAFVRRRLGAELFHYAADPFVAGVYAGDPEALSMPAAFPRLHALEQTHGSLLRGQLAAARARKQQGETTGRPRSFSFRQGMQTLPEALARHLSHYIADATVIAIDRDSDGRFTLRTKSGGAPSATHARAVVIATPAFAASPLVAPFAPAAARALDAIAYAPVAIVATGHRRENVAHPLDGFGMLVPGCERRQILGTLFSSTLFDDRAPPGEVLLTTFVGGRRQPALVELEDGALNALVAQELAELLGARVPRWSRILRWPRAIPQYERGHRERVRAALEATASVPGLYLCGSWRDGVALGERVDSAYAIADEVAPFLRRL